MKKFLFAALLALSPVAAQAQCGEASYYGPGLNGSITANGERFNSGANTAAHPWLPMGSYLRVTNQNNGKSVTVRVNDRGPYAGGRVIDLAEGAASRIGLTYTGVAPVCITRL
jgi:rare lipoprotein A